MPVSHEEKYKGRGRYFPIKWSSPKLPVQTSTILQTLPSAGF